VLKHRLENKIIHVLHCWRCSSYSTPNRYQLKDGGALCGFCGDKNPLGNLVRLPLMLVTEPHTIYVAFTRSGQHAHGLHTDLKTALGPWVVFASGDVLEKTLVYLGITQEQLTDDQDGMRMWGQGTSKLTIQPHRKNLLRIDYRRLWLQAASWLARR
jgi:hypothetical protein